MARLNVEMDDCLATEVEVLAERFGCTAPEAVRRAIAAVGELRAALATEPPPEARERPEDRGGAYWRLGYLEATIRRLVGEQPATRGQRR